MKIKLYGWQSKNVRSLVQLLRKHRRVLAMDSGDVETNAFIDEQGRWRVDVHDDNPAFLTKVTHWATKLKGPKL